jgi:cytochrome c peroxidase
MKKAIIVFLLSIGVFIVGFRDKTDINLVGHFTDSLAAFDTEQQNLLAAIKSADITDTVSQKNIIAKIAHCRRKLKAIDLWLRYIDPNAYRLINGPLPVEWETEVFEKFEKPYRRIGAGLSIAETYLGTEGVKKDSLISLIGASIKATATYSSDVNINNLKTPDVFLLGNRLFLLNLASIYTTGFECPNKDRIIPELENMLIDTNKSYQSYNASFSDKPITAEYERLYQSAIIFVKSQPKDYTLFDHFTFIRDYVNPLFTLNQQMIINYRIVSRSNLDFTINNEAKSIFDKTLYSAQDTKGVFKNVDDELSLKEIDSIGRLLFFDPILSGNNLRSCASCHKPDEFFTSTTIQSPLQFNRSESLSRNAPSLINSPFNHLVMLDGKSLSLQEQGRAVLGAASEMGSSDEQIIDKVLSCKTYQKAFKKFLKLTPMESEVNINHILSAITFYYGKFSDYYSSFDYAIVGKKTMGPEEKSGFNLFMGKAQCATCHFVPTFSGIKPPFIGNEFEVIGVPADTMFKELSSDKGRHLVNPANETLNAFRTTTLRNAANTKPYMHNGVFKTLEQVINFYDGGGGKGHKLQVDNQTLSADSLKLKAIEKKQLIAFIKSLSEDVKFDKPPAALPASKNKAFNSRRVGGDY